MTGAGTRFPWRGRFAASWTVSSAASDCVVVDATRTGVLVGDAVDFWRVEAVERQRLLRLRAEMKLPGRAWLEFSIDAADPERPGAASRKHSSSRAASPGTPTGGPSARSTTSCSAP